jgi:hypothetical protein
MTAMEKGDEKAFLCFLALNLRYLRSIYSIA